MYKISMSFIIIVINYIIQTVIAPSLSIGNASVNFVVILVVSFALMNGKLEGTLIGFFSGLLIDIFFGNVLGFYALLYMYIGFGCGFFSRSFYRDNALIPMIIVGVSDFAYNIAVYLFTYLLRGRIDIGFYFMQLILPEVLYTTLLSLIIYRFYLYINRLIEDREKREETVE